MFGDPPDSQLPTVTPETSQWNQTPSNPNCSNGHAQAHLSVGMKKHKKGNEKRYLKYLKETESHSDVLLNTKRLFN